MKAQNEHGKPVNLPGIVVGWDQKAQMVRLKFDTNEFLKWEFVIMVLEAAVEQAKFNLSIKRAEAMAKAREEALLDMAIQQQMATSGNQPGQGGILIGK